MRVNSVVAGQNTLPMHQGMTTPMYKHVSAGFDKNFTGAMTGIKEVVAVSNAMTAGIQAKAERLTQPASGLFSSPVRMLMIGVAALFTSVAALAQAPPVKVDYGMDTASMIEMARKEKTDALVVADAAGKKEIKAESKETTALVVADAAGKEKLEARKEKTDALEAARTAEAKRAAAEARLQARLQRLAANQ